GPQSNAIEFTANSLPQTIDFPVIPPKKVGDTPFVLNATASSSLPVTYGLMSGPGVLVNDTVIITGPGSIVINAFQAGSVIYDPATPVSQSIDVAGKPAPNCSGLVSPSNSSITVSRDTIF